MSENLLIVVGAGASKEFGLPIGDELKTHISKLLSVRGKEAPLGLGDGDPILYSALQLQSDRHDTDLNSLLMAAKSISANLPLAISIDNFIDNHAGDTNVELVGKLGIVRSILQAERKSNLYFDDRNTKSRLDFASLQTLWLTKFFRLLTENCKLDDLPERMQRITLIVFNYDRCIEHFMFHALRSYYGTTSGKAAELVAMMQIYHPYGTVGALPWQDNTQHKSAFGCDPSPPELLALAAGIKTFTEGTDPNSSEIITIKRQVLEAEVALFLGFAFHPLNVALLSTGSKHEKYYRTRYFATAFGVSDNDCEYIKVALTGIAGAEYIHVHNTLTCERLFHEFGRAISASYR